MIRKNGRDLKRPCEKDQVGPYEKNSEAAGVQDAAERTQEVRLC